MSNIQRNTAEINKYRKELKAMLGDISGIDVKIMNIAVNKGLASAKQSTHVKTGFMKKMWGTTPTKKTRKGVEKGLYNGADYSSFVNDGHRLVNSNGETVGFIDGQHMLEKAEKAVRRSMKQEFDKEVQRINGKYNK